MSKGRTQRRLAAILPADVVDYSRLMGADETGTLTALKRVRKDLIDPAVANHHGRIVKLMGDGILAEFASVVDAVECASVIQKTIGDENPDESNASRIVFRIGINLGDVIIDGDDIYGDGVNIAARLEALAAPGGICVSENAYEQVRDKLDLHFEDLGPQALKNISRPVQTYSVRTRKDVADVGDVQPVLTQPTLPTLPDKPSIAVLPFDNMSGDPEQEYFSDGLSEDIITALSQLDQLFVISRNSSFTYKNEAVDVRKVATELGVRYVLEGSVRKSGDRLRITGQLIDGANGAHLWANRFDGLTEDIFDLQDQITERVIGAIEPTLRKAEIERSRRTRPENLVAYDYFLRALPHLYAMQPDDNVEALAFLHKAIDLEPNFAPALAYAAWCYEQRLTREWPTAEATDASSCISLARRAIATGSDDAHTIAAAGFVLMMVGRDHDAGLSAAERAGALNPNTATISLFAGMVFNFSGRPEAARPCFERALRLSPEDPTAFMHLLGLAIADLLSGNAEGAAEFARKSVAQNPQWDFNLFILATALAELDLAAESRAAVETLRSFTPNATVALYRKHLPFKERASIERILSALSAGGLPEA